MPTNRIENDTPPASTPARPRNDKSNTVLEGRRGFAALMGLGTSTFDKLRAAGRIGPPVIRLGGSVRWHRAEIEAWLAHRAPSGELYDATSWPAIWMQLQARKK